MAPQLFLEKMPFLKKRYSWLHDSCLALKQSMNMNTWSSGKDTGGSSIIVNIKSDSTGNIGSNPIVFTNSKSYVILVDSVV